MPTATTFGKNSCQGPVLLALALALLAFAPLRAAAQPMSITIDMPEINVELLLPDGRLAESPAICQDKQAFSNDFLPEEAMILAEARCRKLLLEGAAFNISRSPIAQTLGLTKTEGLDFKSLAQSLTEVKTASFEQIQDESGNNLMLVNVAMNPLYTSLPEAIKAGALDSDLQKTISASLALEAETLKALESKLNPAKDQQAVKARSETNALKAMQLVRQCLAHPPKSSPSQTQVAQVEQLMNQAARLDPSNPLVFYLLGDNQLKSSRAAQAVASFTQALKLSPSLTPALFGRGTAYMRLNLLDLALADYNKALELSPEQPEYYMGRASTWLIKENFPAMCNDFKEACSRGQCDGYHWATSRGHCK